MIYNMKQLICKNCEKKFLTRPAAKRKYCSQSCAAKANKNILKAAPMKRRGIYDSCRNCQKEIYLQQNEIGRKKYCSAKCYYSSLEKKEVSKYNLPKDTAGEKNGRYKMGEWMYRNKAFKELPHECEICFRKGKLVAHHKNYNRKDSRIENLSLLCWSCHLWLHKYQSLQGESRIRFLEFVEYLDKGKELEKQ